MAVIFSPQIKIIAALILACSGLGYALYWQIGKTAETAAALKVFQAELAAQLDENKRVNSLLIDHQKKAQAARQQTQTARREANAVINSKPPTDCVNSALPDDIRVLFNASKSN